MGQAKVTRTHVVLPQALVDDIDRRVGKRRRSAFLADAARREVKRLALLDAIDAAAGSWNSKDHPELRQGAARWVAKLRKEGEQRIKGLTKR